MKSFVNLCRTATRVLALSALISLMSSVAFAGTIIRNDNNGLWNPQSPGAGSNIFEDLNAKLKDVRKGSPNVTKDGMPIDPQTGLPGLSNVRQAYPCPICREPLFKHSDPNFECIPKDKNGDAVKGASIVERTAQCPICKHSFVGALRGNVNDKSGADRDFCMHSIGKAVIHSNVWACPDCGYAALVDKFEKSWDDKPLGAEVDALVRKKLAPEMRARLLKQIGVREEQVNKPGFKDVDKFSEYITQDQIKDWIKYDNAIALYKEQKAPHVLMARLYLEAAHACRREINSELSVPFLHTVVQEGISKSIRRVQNDLIGASLQVRREKQIGGLFDPNRPETDAVILTEAAKMIIDYGETTGRRIEQEIKTNPNANRNAASQFYTRGDMFVLYTRYAGFLDRIGRMDDAEKTLNEARKIVPLDAATNGGEPLEDDVAKFVEKQLQRIKDFIDDRKACLKKEREYLTRAMWEGFAAIHQGEIRFSDPKNWLKSTDKDGMDPAMNAYTLGELARRCGEPGAAPVWFQAAKKIVEKQSAQLDLEEKELGAALAQADSKPLRDRADALRRRWDIVREWTTEQLAISTAGGELDSKIREVLDKVLIASGVDPKGFKVISDEAVSDAQVMTAAKNAAVKAPAAVTPAAPAQPTAPVVGKINTREGVYKVYYAGIKKYYAEKKTNPPDLITLVKGKYVSQEDSNLDGSGGLICPESHDPLKYSKSYEFGSDADFVIFSSKNAATSKTLYADGSIKIPANNK